MKESNLENKLQKIDEATFQHDLLHWFHDQKRSLPWREDQDPYKVWVSEIMLQQTKVDTVIPYFNRFIEKFPTVEKLAEAEEQDVLKAWEGLGYYSRAKNLQYAVREVAETYNGQVPNNAKQLSALKGVGPYTTGAILSIAYGVPEPAVDGNVMRVLSRILMIEDDIAKASTRRIFERAVRELISHEDPSGFNQGLMELGALACTPKSPACMLCPVQSHCQAFDQGTQLLYPVKTKAKKQKKLAYFTCVLQNKQGEFFIEQRPNEGLLANMWQFPMVLKQDVDEEHLEAWVEEKFQVSIKEKEKLPGIKHVFSHVIWDLDVRMFQIESEDDSNVERSMLKLDDLSAYPFPVPFQKLIRSLN